VSFVKLSPFALLAGALVIAGCSSDSSTPASGGSTNAKTAPPTSSTTSGSGVPDVGPVTPKDQAKPTEPVTEPATSTAPTPEKPKDGKTEPVASPDTAAGDIQKTNQNLKPGDWRPAKISLVQLAQKVDNALKTHPGLLGNQLLEAKWSEGKGIAALESRVQTPTKFWVSYSEINARPRMERRYIIGDGKRMGLLLASGMKPLKPTDPQFNLSSDEIVRRWPFEFGRLIFAGLVSPNGGLTPYARALAAGKGGYQVRVDERTVMAKGKSVPEYRIYAIRPAGKQGIESEIEMIFHAKMLLPFSIRVDEKPDGKAPTHITWHAGWNGPHKFPAKDFTLKQLGP
jgi:hypothetical protein